MGRTASFDFFFFFFLWCQYRSRTQKQSHKKRLTPSKSAPASPSISSIRLCLAIWKHRRAPRRGDGDVPGAKTTPPTPPNDYQPADNVPLWSEECPLEGWGPGAGSALWRPQNVSVVTRAGDSVSPFTAPRRFFWRAPPRRPVNRRNRERQWHIFPFTLRKPEKWKGTQVEEELNGGRPLEKASECCLFLSAAIQEEFRYPSSRFFFFVILISFVFAEYFTGP